MEKNMEAVSSPGRMVLAILVRFSIITSMEMGIIYGLTEEAIKAIGRTIKWKEKGSLLGAMAENTRVIIKMIKNTVQEYLHGQTVGVILGNGQMVNNMEAGNTLAAIE